MEHCLRQYCDLDKMFHIHKECKSGEHIAHIFLEGCGYGEKGSALPGYIQLRFDQTENVLHRGPGSPLLQRIQNYSQGWSKDLPLTGMDFMAVAGTEIEIP